MLYYTIQDEQGPGSLVGLVRQLSSIQDERNVKTNALIIGGCDRRADPDALSLESHWERNNREIMLLENNILHSQSEVDN
jgi:hypothetical protein